MNLEEKIEARIAQLEAELEKFVTEANQKLVAYQAAIAELKKVIAPEEAPKDET